VGQPPVPILGQSVLKKTLDSAQNLENKRLGIFLPPRSMVLKVVAGKILETNGLWMGEGILHTSDIGLLYAIAWGEVKGIAEGAWGECRNGKGRLRRAIS